MTSKFFSKKISKEIKQEQQKLMQEKEEQQQRAAVLAATIQEEELTNALKDAFGETETVAIVPEVKEVIKLEEPKNYHKAVNAYYDKQLKKYMKITIEYDVKTGYAKIVGNEPFADDVAVASAKLGRELALKLFKKEEEL